MNTLIMNIIMLVLALAFTILFILYPRKIANKTFTKKSTTILATIVAPIVILFLAIYTTASLVVSTNTRKAMLNDPEILTDTIKRLEEVEKQKQQDAAKQALKNITEDDSKYAPIMGNADGKVVAYIFYDYNCGYCKGADLALEEILKTESDLKVVLKNFPIFPPSLIPAKAVIAAKEQGKAEDLHKLLFTTRLVPESNPKATEQEITAQIEAIVFGLAEKAGLDVEKLKKDMENPSVEEELLRTRQLASKLGIQGTPAIIIGDNFYNGYVDKSVMLEAINQAK